MNLKPFIKTLEGKPVAVFGLGLSGLAVVKALHESGAKIYAWDDDEKRRAAAKKAGASIKELDEKTLSQCGALVLAPGVPLHYPSPHPVVKAARKAGTEIIGDLEVFHRAGHGRKTIGVTGTNGKSTTAALIHHIVQAAGKKAVLGGNIGTAVFDLKLPPKEGAIVLEMSSYQIDLCPTFHPDIAVLLNITPDHIDRHGSFENYAAAKEAIFGGEGLAVISVDDEPCRAIYERILAFETGKRRCVPISCKERLEKGVYVEEGKLMDAQGDEPVEVGVLSGLSTLRGQHNHQNAAAAYAVCRELGLAPAEIMAGMKTYPGMVHRQYPVRVMNGVSYINDSKATNAEAAAKALAAYSKIFWIAGGRPKDGGLKGIEPFCKNIKHAFLIGEAMNEFAGWLEDHSVEHTLCRTLDKAVAQAHEMAQDQRGQPGEPAVVLLSPACASFDQFSSFEERGDHFTKLVQALSEQDEAA